jgi:ketosteroid isomerase-like protein
VTTLPSIAASSPLAISSASCENVSVQAASVASRTLARGEPSALSRQAGAAPAALGLPAAGPRSLDFVTTRIQDGRPEKILSRLPAGPPEQISRHAVIAFNEAINRRDLESLERMMTDDHTFIDSDDNVLAGKDAVLDAWKGFFEAFPDYRNEWSTVKPAGGALIAVGRSVCSTEPALDGPAIWTARTTGDRVSEWRVHEDTPANRSRLGLAGESD